MQSIIVCNLVKIIINILFGLFGVRIETIGEHFH